LPPARRDARRGTLCALAALLVTLAACGAAPRAEGPRIGGPFALVDQNGAPATEAMLNGKWTAVFFGYTFCPDVCPTTLATLALAQSRLGERARDFRVVFISLDPERDTPGQLRTWLASPAFPRGAVGLTGAPARIATVARAYHVYYRKAGSGAGYSLDHTSVVYLMGPDGAFRRPIDVAEPPERVAAQITAAMDSAR